jgi:hypothetical protein
MSGWECRHERETPLACATASKVTGVPAWSSSRIVWMALARVSSRRRRAAEISELVLLGPIGCLHLLAVVVFQRCDDLFEVFRDLAVHLGDPGLSARLGGGDDLVDLLVVGAVLGEELGGGDEHRAGQAGIRCPLLRPDPAQRPRLAEIRDKLTARISEAQSEGWTGEAEGLQVSLAAADQKLAQMDQIAAHHRGTVIHLEMPGHPVSRTVTTSATHSAGHPSNTI